MTLGKSLPASDVDRESLSLALSQAVDAVKARGKSDAGQKTMLDVLVPISEAMQSGEPLENLAGVAVEAADATIPMQATKGRASFLGERSIGHMDPGARSTVLIVEAVSATLTEAAS